jgi:protein gp37
VLWTGDPMGVAARCAGIHVQPRLDRKFVGREGLVEAMIAPPDDLHESCRESAFTSKLAQYADLSSLFRRGQPERCANGCQDRAAHTRQVTRASTSDIEWTDATWNPVRGCSRISEGCRFCYAERIAGRFSGEGLPYEGLVKLTRGGPRWTGRIALIPDALDLPQRWRKPRTVFVNSMSDLFHERVPAEFISRVFDVMHRANWHQYQILTKRSARLRDLGRVLVWAPHIWMGVSVESEEHYERIDDLRATDAAVKFLSLEPLLGPLPRLDLTGIDWVIVGGESGPGSRPMDASWALEIRDQCLGAGVPFFFKQWGECERNGPDASLMDGPGMRCHARIGASAATKVLAMLWLKLQWAATGKTDRGRSPVW